MSVWLPKTEMEKKFSLRGSLAIVFAAALSAAVGYAVYYWLKANPAIITQHYRPFSRNVLRGMAKFFDLVPFSAAEVLLYALILGALALIVRLLWVLISGCRPRIRYLFRFVAWTALAGVLFIEAYYVLWGMNYFGLTLGAELGLDVKKRSPEELHALADYLVEETNALAPQVRRDETGAFSPDYTFEYFASEVAREFSEFSGKTEPKTKYVIASRGLSHFRTTGIFVAYTGEANVNAENYISSIPFCMAHETAHRYAIAREDEANFMAFLALWDADDPALRYSVYLSALRYTQAQLRSADSAAYKAVAAKYSELINHDNAKYSEYWSQFEGKAAEVSQKTNNAYLSVNGQTDGVKSYGRMVDLLLAWYAEKT